MLRQVYSEALVDERLKETWLFAQQQAAAGSVARDKKDCS